MPDVVDLGYSQYRGTATSLGVTQYLGVRYATPPLNKLRFRAPVKPLSTTGIQDATAFQPIALGTNHHPSPSESEDCLFINVWTPTLATPSSKLPVWVFIQGGGYAANSNANYDGSTVIAASDHNIVFVNFNYRVSSWGFLSGTKVKADGDLNVGLLDQRRALAWVQEHIAQFGGNPDHVVVHGASAGAGSLALHLSAYGGRDDKLFAGVILESPFLPTQPRLSEVEWQFNNFIGAAGCAEAPDKMSCLRSQDKANLQSANSETPHPGRTSVPRFYWTPTIDGDLVQNRPYRMFEEGKFVKAPMMIGIGTNEGSYYAPNASTPAEVRSFFQDNYPRLSSADTAAINAQYPLTPPLPHHEAYFPSASAAYGDATFICPAHYIAQSVAIHHSPTKVWNYRYNVQDSDHIAAGLGVPHTCEIPAIFGLGNTGVDDTKSSYATYNKSIVPVVMNYWISFVRTLDPNVWRHESAPEWKSFGDGDGNGRRLVIETEKTRMEDVPKEFVEKAEFWKGLAEKMGH